MPATALRMSPPTAHRTGSSTAQQQQQQQQQQQIQQQPGWSLEALNARVSNGYSKGIDAPGAAVQAVPGAAAAPSSHGSAPLDIILPPAPFSGLGGGSGFSLGLGPGGVAASPRSPHAVGSLGGSRRTPPAFQRQARKLYQIHHPPQVLVLHLKRHACSAL